MLRVKRDKGTEARRLLLRNTSTGKIIIVRVFFSPRPSPNIDLPELQYLRRSATHSYEEGHFFGRSR